MRRASAFLLACGVAVFCFAGRWVRVNQLGYLPADSKVAVLLCNDTLARADAAAFELLDALTGEVAYRSGNVKHTKALGPFRTTCRLDFSDFSTPGAYLLKVAGTLSQPFAIGTGVYHGAADFLLNYMRQQQCGYNPFQRDSCHTRDGFVRYHPALEGRTVDVKGGWHDAADLLQYTSTSANAIYQLMLAWEQCPQVFNDLFDANGDPGRNGLPDIVDQIKWGLDWLDKMNPEPGVMFNQIADDRDHIGMKMPKDDPADYGRGAGGGRPVYFVDGKPQQKGKGLNATTGTASTAGKFASDFALGATLLRPYYPQFAAKIAEKAMPALQHGMEHPGNTQTVSVLSPYIYEEDNWTDDLELAAAEIYRAQGGKDLLQKAVEWGRREPVTPWMGADSARHYQWYPFMNMGHYRVASLSEGSRRQEFLRMMRSGLENVRQRADGHPFLWGVPGIWCSNNLTTALLTQCILYRQLSGDTAFVEMECSLRDWLLGCNPWGTSMIVELPRGGVYPHAPHSNWLFERVGNATGGLVDGPVYATIFNSLRGVKLTNDDINRHGNTYENLQPGDVVFHDNAHDYSTNEPTMDGTASLVFPLAHYESEGLRQAAKNRDANVWNHGAIVRGDTTQRAVALVFTAHDRADGAQKILKTLHEKHICGAFFLTGLFLEMYPEVVGQMVEDGHYVGSHSNGHLLYADWDNRDSCLVSQDEFMDDMKMAYAKLARFGINRDNAPLFMPPYEWYNDEIAYWTSQLGLQLVNFTSGTYTNTDYTYPGIENNEGGKYCSNKWIWDKIKAKESQSGLNGHILLIHLGTDPRRTEKVYNELPELIDFLKSKGYAFKPLKQLLDY